VRIRKVKYGVLLWFVCASCQAIPFAPTCSIAALTAPNFGTYNPLPGALLNATGVLKVTCANGSANFTIKLNAGNGSGGSFAPRKMQSGTNKLNYNIFTNAVRTTIWGNGTSSTSFITGSGSCRTSNSCRYTMYAQILASQQTAVPGDYTDTVMATLTY